MIVIPVSNETKTITYPRLGFSLVAVYKSLVSVKTTPKSSPDKGNLGCKGIKCILCEVS